MMPLPHIKRRLGSPLRREFTSMSRRIQAKNSLEPEFVFRIAMSGLYRARRVMPLLYLQ
jgi:hypothetical protein